MPRKARRASNRGSGRYGEGQRLVDGASFHLADEIRYIQRRAADHDGRVVTIGQLVLFSSETGDAWLIDRDDRLALRLGSQGDPEPFHIEETDTSFAIDWKGHYRIEGPRIATPAALQPCSVTRLTCSHRTNDRKISNMFG